MTQKRPIGNGHLLPAAPIAEENAGGRGGRRGGGARRRGAGRRRLGEGGLAQLSTKEGTSGGSEPLCLPGRPPCSRGRLPGVLLGRYLPLPEGFRKSSPRAGEGPGEGRGQRPATPRGEVAGREPASHTYLRPGSPDTWAGERPETAREPAGRQGLPLVCRSCKSASAGKKRRDSTQGWALRGEKSGPRLTSLPTPCHFLLKRRSRRFGEGRGAPAGRESLRAPRRSAPRLRPAGRLQSRLENPRNPRQSPLRGFSAPAASPKSCCIPGPKGSSELGAGRRQPACAPELPPVYAAGTRSVCRAKYLQLENAPHPSPLERCAGRRLHSTVKSLQAPPAAYS